MSTLDLKKCQYCESTNIGIGYHLGNGKLFIDPFAYHSSSSSSDVETYLCKDCGSILYSKVLRPEIFENLENTRNDELLDYMNHYGFLLMNEHPTLPSLSSLGYSIQNLVYLIEHQKVFYSKAFHKKPIYLSTYAYQLLKRVKDVKPLTQEAKEILCEMKKYEFIDKSDLRNSMNLDEKIFQKSFEFLLENLYITAFAGKKLNQNWYSYLYGTSEHFNQKVEGLHFHGDAKKELWKIFEKRMDLENFEILCR